MVEASPRRGQIWLAHVGLDEPKRFVVVSNNLRNRNLESVLGVRLTTSPRPDFPSIAHFAPGEIGDSECWAVADDTWPIYKDDIVKGTGAVPARLMTRIDEALHAALDLQH